MPIEKRDRNIRLKDLKNLYIKELKDEAFRSFAPEMEQGIVRKVELEEAVLHYYKRTTASLQEFYSRFTPEWDAYYSCLYLPPQALADYLRTMRGTFQKRYGDTQLNLSFYIGLMEDSRVSLQERVQRKELFLNQWYALLNRDEYSYQYLHVQRLCQTFEIFQLKRGQRSGNALLGSRTRWLLHNYPELYRKMVPFEETVKRHPTLQQLVKLLGRKNRKQQCFDVLSGIDKRRLVRHSAKSDIEGITQGNDLGSLLPIEYCYYADEQLESYFLVRYTEKQLQQFRYQSSVQEPSKENQQLEKGIGPYIICVDTSGSMQGDRERLSKSAILAIAQLTEKTHRKCYVVNFSDEAVSLAIENLSTDMPKLAEFLNHSFQGGTDIAPALHQAEQLIQGNEYRESDVILISDFEMPMMTPAIEKMVRGMKQRHTSFFGLVFGNRPEMEYLNICEKYWEL